jgi:hypothetical protein
MDLVRPVTKRAWCAFTPLARLRDLDDGKAVDRGVGRATRAVQEPGLLAQESGRCGRVASLASWRKPMNWMPERLRQATQKVRLAVGAGASRVRVVLINELLRPRHGCCLMHPPARWLGTRCGFYALVLTCSCPASPRQQCASVPRATSLVRRYPDPRIAIADCQLRVATSSSRASWGDRWRAACRAGYRGCHGH